MDKFQAPTTYEEAVERKENLLNKLNKYMYISLYKITYWKVNEEFI